MSSLRTEDTRYIMYDETRNVVQASKERIEHIWNNNDRVYVSYSGGKDSICLANVILETGMAGRIDLKKTHWLFVDEEAIYPCVDKVTRNFRLKVLSMGMKFYWYCLPFKHFSCLEELKPNDYNPNKVLKQNLELLKESILNNGWTLPIVVRPDFTIIDGFHRWTIAGEEPLRSMLGGKVPIVIVEHDNKEDDMVGTVTHNRARGTHLLEPMEKIVQALLKEGSEVKDVAKKLGMKEEEVYRLSGFKREDFLKLMAGDKYSQARIYKGMY